MEKKNIKMHKKYISSAGYVNRAYVGSKEIWLVLIDYFNDDDAGKILFTKIFFLKKKKWKSDVVSRQDKTLFYVK